MQASDSAAEATAQPTADAAPLSDADARFQRTMKIAVGVLGFLVVAALTAVVIRVIYLASSPAKQPVAETPVVEAQQGATPAAAPSPAIRPAQSLRLPRGAVVRSVALSGDRLAVHYEAEGRAGVAVLDLKTGRTITTVGIESAPVDQ